MGAGEKATNRRVERTVVPPAGLSGRESEKAMPGRLKMEPLSDIRKGAHEQGWEMHIFSFLPENIKRSAENITL